MRFAIVKCHGSGNDFPMIDARGLALGDAEWAIVARALSDRAGPVGGDGILLLGPARGGADFAMTMRNADGSEAETCLNGLRCVARAGFAATGLSAATVALKISEATAVRAEDLAPGVYTVRERAGPATLDLASWPMHIGAAILVDAPISALSPAQRFTAVRMPNPHLVAFVEAIDEAELARIGALCEAAPDWLPGRANVSFVEVRGDALFVRTFERGVGLTDSCGSAMGASLYAACLTGRVGYGVDTMILNRGGMIRGHAEADAMVTLSGNATYEWAGRVTVDMATGIASDLVVEQRFPDEVAAWDALKARIAG